MEILVIIWLTCGIVSAMVYSGKGHSGCVGFIGGFLLGPIGIVLAICSPEARS